jgi:hypothetical protein
VLELLLVPLGDIVAFMLGYDFLQLLMSGGERRAACGEVV